MARGDPGSIFSGFRGRLNDFIVIKQRNGKPVMCFYPTGQKIKWTENQKQHRFEFKMATDYARWSIKNADRLAFYQSYEHDGINAYNLAIADYMHKPMISSMDIRKARKPGEYLVRVHATDDFIITRVEVAFCDFDNKRWREDAVQVRKSGIWNYRISVDQLCTVHAIKALAYDYPGNQATMEYKVTPEEAQKWLPHR